MEFSKFFSNKKVVLLDGAMGTELQRRGVITSLPLWSAKALIQNKDIVIKIHEDYIKAGAEVITANTFRTNERTIKRSGLKISSGNLTKIAVDLAFKAAINASKKVFIAGSIAPVEDCYEPDLVPSNRELREEHNALASSLLKAGVGLILIETMNTIREAFIAAEAAKNTNLPFLVSFVVKENGNLLSGENLIDATKTLSKLSPKAFLINCIPTKISLKPLRLLRSSTESPIGIYANGIGKPDAKLGWEFSGKNEIGQYLKYSKKWVDLGAKVIGGCCGTTPEYISAIRKLIDSKPLPK